MEIPSHAAKWGGTQKPGSHMLLRFILADSSLYVGIKRAAWIAALPLRLCLKLFVEQLPLSMRAQAQGGQHAAATEIAELRTRLLDLGFAERAYMDLETIANKDGNYSKRIYASFELAAWHANQNTKNDAQKCLDFLTFVFAAQDRADMTQGALVLQTEALCLLGKEKLARDALKTFTSNFGLHPDLSFAHANTLKDTSEKLAHINEVFMSCGVAPVSGKSYDTLTAAEKLEPTTDESLPLVTIIVPTYNAAKTIKTTLQSLIDQTWQNLEIIVSDDASTDKTLEVVAGCAQQDKRIKLIKNKINRGAYIARNEALKVATGDFVTVNDADDWSHAEKIAQQANHLRAYPDAVANTSQSARIDNDLQLYRRGNPGYYIQTNLSSLMFRRTKVMKKLGYWDSVRFGADSEMLERIKLAFGAGAVAHMQHSVFALLRFSKESLTSSSAFGFPGFFMGARKEYDDSQAYFHAQAQSLYYDYPMKTRPFLVPEPMKPEYQKSSTPAHVDVVIAADFGKPEQEQAPVIEAIKTAYRQERSVGVVQVYAYDEQSASSEVRDYMQQYNTRTLVYGETITCDELLVFDNEALADQQRYLPKIHAKTGQIFASESGTTNYAKNVFSADTWELL